MIKYYRKSTENSEEHISSFFMVEERAMQGMSTKLWLAYSSTLKMKAIQFSEKSYLQSLLFKIALKKFHLKSQRKGLFAVLFSIHCTIETSKKLLKLYPI
jgi:hypothetical protein